MFGWLRWKLASLVSPRSSRRVFAYFDGKHWRRIDPLQAYYELQNHAEFIADRHPREAAEGEQSAVEVCAKAVCDVFDIKPYDTRKGTGLTITERVNLLYTFGEYIGWLKKNTEPSLSVPPSTEPTSESSSEETTNDSPRSTAPDTTG